MERFPTTCPTSLTRLLTAATVAAIILLPNPASGQAEAVEEIVIAFEVPRLLQEDIFVLYDGRTVFLPMIRLFNLLQLNVQADFSEKTFSGFVISEKDQYHIDLNTFRVKARDGEYHLLPSEFSLERNELYLTKDLYQHLFDLNMTFDFSELKVVLPLNEDFPGYQKMHRQSKRRLMHEKKMALKDVRELPHRRDYLKGGVLDWTLGTNPLERDGQYYSLTLGGVALGGDIYVAVAGDIRNRFDTKQLAYRWHYFLNKPPYVTQVELGKVVGAGALSRQLTGFMVTNRPQVQREYFQTIEITGYVGENWEVELYSDHKLVDFMTTDSRGEYSFMLDVNYGAAAVELKMYGPNGEIRTEDRFVRIPHNLIPKGEIEYTVATGTSPVRGSNRTYSQASGFYGIHPRFTAGISAEVPVTTTYGDQLLLASEAILQVANNLTITGSLSPDNMTTGSFNFSKPSILNANGSYTKFSENNVRNPLNQRSRLQLALSVPLKIKQRHFGLRYYVSVDNFSFHRSISMNFGFSASLAPVNINYSGRYKLSQFSDRNIGDLVSQLLLSPRLYRWLRPQFRIDYDHSQNQIAKYAAYINKRIFRTGQLTLSLERNHQARSNSIMLSFSIFGNFAHFNSRMFYHGDGFNMSQLQWGSIRYDQEGNRILLDRQSAVGYGTAVVKPFLDANYNGHMDVGEEYLSGLRAKIAGVSGRPRGDDRLYYYERLRPYDEYMVQIDEYSLDDPMLKPTNENYRVILNPNVVTAIEVPLVLCSEMTGQINRRTEYGDVGTGGIRIVLVNLSKDIMSEITSFTDGDFYFLGLLPGSYRAYIDPAQLEQYGYVSRPESIEFRVEAVEGGTSIEDVNFLLVPKPQAKDD